MLEKKPNKPKTPPADSGPTKPDDEVTQRLREAAHRKRPWSVRSCLLTILLFSLPLVFLAWWFWPRPEPAKLVVIAFDQIAIPGKPVTLRAATELLEPHDGGLSGHLLFFENITPGEPRSQPDKARTDKRGFARAVLTVQAPARVALIEVVYLNETGWQRWFNRDQAQVLCLPPDARLLVVDVEPTLKSINDWSELAKALTQANERGWYCGYLATNADSPLAYRKLRDWVMGKARPADATIPRGPVLARQTWHTEQSEAAARKECLAALKAAITGPVLYLTAADGIKLRTVAVDGDLEGEPIAVAGWAKLVECLPK